MFLVLIELLVAFPLTAVSALAVGMIGASIAGAWVGAVAVLVGAAVGFTVDQTVWSRIKSVNQRKMRAQTLMFLTFLCAAVMMTLYSWGIIQP